MSKAEPFVSALRDGIPDADWALCEAIQWAARLHKGQLDKGGQPYVLHPLRVMQRVGTTEGRIAALLHDVVEDCDVAPIAIYDTFGQVVGDAVVALTRRGGESYSDFISRCASNPVAARVKLADIEDNMDLSRLGREPAMADARRQMKYADARNFLLRAAQGMGAEGENSRSEVEGEARQPGPKDAPKDSQP